MRTKMRKKNIRYFTFLSCWMAFLALVLVLALVWFYWFLKSYQKVFDETRPLLYQNEVMQLFEARDAAKLLAQAEPVALGPFESMENFTDFLNAYLADKKMAFGPKKGEHIEERPVYVVTADETPFAVVRLKKKEETASYGLPLWETGSIELLPLAARSCQLLAPATVTVTVNGITVTQDALVESGIRGTAEDYVENFVQIPSYCRYDLGQFYGEPALSAVNAANEPVEITYDENTLCYQADFGSDQALREEMEDFLIQAVTDYAMYVSNDAPYDALDKYFPKKSPLLYGLKNNSREWFDYHLRPEIKNQELREFIVYSPDAIFARVYLEQYMYVPYSKKTEMLVTDLPIYFVKINGEWKVSGIIFQ